MFDDSIYFKYRAINVNTLCSIASSQVWFANFSQLNDPYDCNPEITVDIEGKSVDEILATSNVQLKGSPSSREKANLLERSLIKHINRAGVYCVTKNPCNEIMWAFYADAHRGIIIGHEVRKENINNRDYPHRTPTEMDYKGRSRVRMSDLYKDMLKKPGHEDAYNRMIREAYFSKAEAWEYEDEYRFLSVREYGFKDIDADITIVIYGARIHEHHVSLIQKLISNKVSQYRSIITTNGIEIVPFRT